MQIKPKRDLFRFAQACKLEQVHIICEQVWILDVIERRIFSKFTTLRKVELTFSWFWLVLSTAGMDALDARFGVRRYLATVGTTTDTTLFWEAPKGQILKVQEPTSPLRDLLILQPIFMMYYQ